MKINVLEDEEAYLSVIMQTTDGQQYFQKLLQHDNPQAFLIEVECEHTQVFSYQGKSYVILYGWTETIGSGRVNNYYLIGLPDDVYCATNDSFLLKYLDSVLSFEFNHVARIRFFLKDRL